MNIQYILDIVKYEKTKFINILFLNLIIFSTFLVLFNFVTGKKLNLLIFFTLIFLYLFIFILKKLKLISGLKITSIISYIILATNFFISFISILNSPQFKFESILFSLFTILVSQNLFNYYLSLRITLIILFNYIFFIFLFINGINLNYIIGDNYLLNNNFKIAIYLITITSILYIYLIKNEVVLGSYILRCKKYLKKVYPKQKLNQQSKTNYQKLYFRNFDNYINVLNIGRKTVSIVHDLANPVSIATLNLNLLLNDKIFEKAEFQSVKSRITRTLAATNRMEDYLHFIRLNLISSSKVVKFNPVTLVEKALQILENQFQNNNIKVFLVNNVNINCIGISEDFIQLLLNIITNSIESFDEKDISRKRIKIELKCKSNKLFICICDNGIGIKKENIVSLFMLFFTTKDVIQYKGLGLFISKYIVENEFMGNLSIKSRLGYGTRVYISLPFIPLNNT